MTAARTPSLPRRATSAALAVCALAASAVALAAPASASTGDPLPGGTRFYTPPTVLGAQGQIDRLTAKGDTTDAALLSTLVHTPQAVWLDGGSPARSQQQVGQTAQQAAATGTVPTFVLYNAPGRDCSQYSSGGAGSDDAYRAWADGVAAGLVAGQRVIVVVEPDGLANLPSDCPSAYPGQDVAALTAGRIADIHYAGQAVEKADPQALVYLDAGHSAWHSVGDIAQRLDQAGVDEFQGFSLDVSNYQPTPQLVQYGSWVAKCQYLVTHLSGAYSDCASQYYPATPTDPTTWTLTDQWYAQHVDDVAGGPTSPRQLPHFVVDTSRNGRGAWAGGAGEPDPQTWCNPPGSGAGVRPTAATGNPLADAFLWIKLPGQSDGQCNRGVAGSTTDPEWQGITDPAAGAWFPRQALQLARFARPHLS